MFSVRIRFRENFIADVTCEDVFHGVNSKRLIFELIGNRMKGLCISPHMIL